MIRWLAKRCQDDARAHISGNLVIARSVASKSVQHSVAALAERSCEVHTSMCFFVNVAPELLDLHCLGVASVKNSAALRAAWCCAMLTYECVAHTNNNDACNACEST